jgi:hypothetical protein
MLEKKEFKTDNLGLAPYLEMSGLKYLRSELTIGKYDKPVIVFVFDDPRGVGKDLELDFVRSDVKRYRDLLFFFRNEIEKLKRRLDTLNAQDVKSQDRRFEEE